jgi:hypothetical protein
VYWTSEQIQQACTSHSDEEESYAMTFSTASRRTLWVADFTPLGSYGFPERYAKLQGDFPIRSIRCVLHAETDFPNEE